MKRILSRIIFWISGWEAIGTFEYPKKCIVIAAPHTSNWDFLIGRCYGYIGRIKIRSSKPLFYDSYKRNRHTGSIILIDPNTNATIAAGMIL